MIRTFALPLACLALPAAALAQSDADRAADAAEVVTAQAQRTFEEVDPDLAMDAGDDAAAVYAGLPPLTAAPAFTIPEPEPEAEAPRGPAVRMIPAPVVQPLAEAPAVAAPTPAALAGDDPFVIKSILPIEGSIRYGDWFWDESAAPKTGKLVITVDLEARVISAFRDGHEIGTAVALLGTQQHPTPLGSFPILTKEKDNVSEKYNNAPMPWTLRLTWDGIAIHGSPVMNGYASHGCIGVPDEFAAKLFAASKRGDKVIITRGKMIGVGDKVM
ncbi:L,D-transpeptidase family protein [Porphyrobacter sp. YT40]|uniref:L,D-transpeptidase family protein n=1 Tax=Porphyrobacter sp. YT40 TaxID=2547601 RepID=UPI00114480FF|nr:L,D-transpeptidase family protein [Porphyrobacter sp. YT40]QDH35919.1 L,D-transpeptidase family protein [Porphyrobacter sp. YT40]